MPTTDTRRAARRARSVLELGDPAPLAVREIPRARGGRVWRSVLRQAAAHPHVLADVVEENLPIGAVAAQRHRRVGLEGPVLHLPARVFDVHEEVRMRVLPIQLGERAGELAALLAV